MSVVEAGVSATGASAAHVDPAKPNSAPNAQPQIALAVLLTAFSRMTFPTTDARRNQLGVCDQSRRATQTSAHQRTIAALERNDCRLPALDRELDRNIIPRS